MIYGYARCSTNEDKQDINRQVRELRSAGAELTFVEYEHGDTADKKELSLLLEKAEAGDTILTTEVSRLSRSTKQLCEIIDTIQRKRLKLEILGSITIDCRSGQLDPMTKAFLQIPKDQVQDIVVVLDRLLRQGLPIRLAVFVAKPPQVLRDTNTRDVSQRNANELREDHFENVSVHGDSSGAVRAIPHTKREPHFIDKGIESVGGSGGQRGLFLLLSCVLLFDFFLPLVCFFLGLLPCLCGGEISRGIPCGAFEDLLATRIPPQASLELERYYFLSFCFLLNVSHVERLSGRIKGEMERFC